MKKTILIVGLVVAALVVLGVGVAFAQGPAPYAGNGPMLQNLVSQKSRWKINLPQVSQCTRSHLIMASNRKPSQSS